MMQLYGQQTAILSVTFGIPAHNNIRLYTNVDTHMRSDKNVIISHLHGYCQVTLVIYI